MFVRYSGLDGIALGHRGEMFSRPPICVNAFRYAATWGMAASRASCFEPGFRIVVDLTELQSMEVACSPLIAEIMEICNAGGVSEVLRIIPDPTRDIGLQILSFFHYGDDVYIRTCASTDEAEALLAEEAA